MKILALIVGLVVAVISLPVIFTLAGGIALSFTAPAVGLAILGTVGSFIAITIVVAKWVLK